MPSLYVLPDSIVPEISKENLKLKRKFRMGESELVKEISKENLKLNLDDTLST